MRPVLSASEYRRVDQAYEGDLGEAMERAGYAVALAAVRHGAAYGQRVVVLAGTGNNGGDGYVAARYLRRRGVDVVVHRLGQPRADLARQAASKARAEGVPVTALGAPVEANLVIDALFGGGSRQGLPEEVVGWMDIEAPVIAVDFPTGLDPDSGEVADRAFQAVETVTFSTLKTGHVTGRGPDHCGRVTVVDIGIDGGRPSMFLVEESDALRPARARRAHKWSAGAVLVVGGSEGMIGATVLAARSALNFGAGAIYMSSPHPDEAHLMAPQIPTIPLGETGRMLDRFDVVVIGPGLADDDIDPVLPIAEKAEHVLLDAGGLVPDLLEAASKGGQVVVTPHAAEFKRLSGVGVGWFTVRAFARKSAAVVLVKGNPTRISDGGPPLLVSSGGPELASIGTGDVLSGMVAALWARGLDASTATLSGAYWHGVAATQMREQGTVTADALADHIGRLAW